MQPNSWGGAWDTCVLVPRPSITANAVEGLVKLLRRMTSGRRLEPWYFWWTAVLMHARRDKQCLQTSIRRHFTQKFHQAFHRVSCDWSLRTRLAWKQVMQYIWYVYYTVGTKTFFSGVGQTLVCIFLWSAVSLLYCVCCLFSPSLSSCPSITLQAR